MKDAGYEVKQGQHFAFKTSGQQNLRDYDPWVKDILKMSCDLQFLERVHRPKARGPYRENPDKFNLLVDIQAKLNAGKGPGYEHWAKVFCYIKLPKNPLT